MVDCVAVYQYNVFTKETYNATGKAKGDIIDILNSLNINDLYKPSRFRLIRIIQQYLSIKKLNNNSDILFIQYPAIIDKFIEQASVRANLVAIIHDLQSIRGTKTISDEISLLNHFSTVISHNHAMTTYLLNNGFKNQIIDLELFDYLHNINKPVQINNFNKKRVCFAGNLNKSKFINKLDNLKNTDFLLYGLLDNKNIFKGDSNVEYFGSVPSDEIVYKLVGEFGLVWDGEDIDTCSGVLGNYLKFNNPHKLSLYLAAGKPVIVWKNSAIAKFVEDNHIGISVSSLYNLHSALINMSDYDYIEMVNNVKNIKTKIANGFYTKQAIKNILS